MSSFELLTQEEIVNHLENNSPTKYMYSFPKSERFRKIDKRGKSDTFYNLPPMIMTRGAGIGFGQKYDFTRANLRDTELASIKRSYEDNNFPGQKYTFGLGREKFNKQVCPGYKYTDKEITGPASYDTTKTFGNTSPKYTIRSLCGKTFWTINNKGPGPGMYSPKSTINKDGMFVNSKITNIKGAAFSKSNTNRWRFYKRNFIFIIFICYFKYSK